MLFVRAVIESEERLLGRADAPVFATGDCKGPKGGGNNGGDRDNQLN